MDPEASNKGAPPKQNIRSKPGKSRELLTGTQNGQLDNNSKYISVDFLEEIRLRGQMDKGGLMGVNDPANERKKSAVARPVEEDNSLTAALQRGLVNIHNAAHGSDSEEDSDSDSEDSWDEEDC